MTLTLGLFTFIRQYTTDWGYIAAAGILTCLPALVFFFLLQRADSRLDCGGDEGIAGDVTDETVGAMSGIRRSATG